MRNIEIFDTTLRDGEQGVSGFKDHEESKIIIAKKLMDLNVSTIEAGFPFSSKGDYNAVQKIAREINGPYICALARCVKNDIDLAWNSIKDNEKPTIHVFDYMVDKQSLAAYKIRKFDKVIESSVFAVGYAKELMKGKGRVEFSAQNATIGKRDQIYELYSRVIESGANVVNLPDTSGYSLPHDMFDFFCNFIKNVPKAKKVVISTHCHNDLGLATANSIASIMGGSTQVEGTINGIGERAGNASLEEVIMSLRTRRKSIKADTNINAKLFGEISRLVSIHSGFLVQPNKAIVGENAFKHGAGIHEDGVKKGAFYEIMNQRDVGWSGESFALTSRSGKKGYMHRLEKIGYKTDITKKYIKEIVLKGKDLTDKVGKLRDVDLRYIVDEIVYPVNKKAIIFKKIVKYGKDDDKYNGVVILKINGKEITKKGTSDNGIIDALFSAVDLAFDSFIPKLVIYDPRNIGKNHSATAEATVVLSDNGFRNDYSMRELIYIGKSKNKDTVEASVKAYINAINRYVHNNQKTTD